MKYYRIAFLVAAILGLNASASTFQESMDKLSVEDPEFVVHMNLESDFNNLGTFFSEVYMAYLAMTPDVPPIPVDFAKLFDHLGFNGMTSALWVSEARPGGGFINQSLIQFEDTPKGAFLLMGEVNAPFDILQTAPADADLVMEFNFNGIALYGIIRDILIDLMGPLGQGIIDAQMNQPLIEEGPTLGDLIDRLSTRMQMAVRLNDIASPDLPSMLQILQGDAVLRIDNVADLLEEFSPMLEASGFLPVDGESGSYKFRSTDPAMPVSVYFQGIKGTNDLLVSVSDTGKTWFLGSGTSIMNSPDFLAVTEGLPMKGTTFWYSNKKISDLQIDGMDADIPSSEQMAPLFDSLKSFLKNFSGTQAGVSFFEDNTHRMITFQPSSYKTNMAVAVAVVPVAIAAGVLPLIQENMEEAAETQSAPTGDPASPID